ncbi:MAG: alkaline phosphatase [Deferribacteraceae bacterium]|jgi:alkaline phosphatase|nr:alkaline phosphatase [Deferribacteraceae bacterium]
MKRILMCAFALIFMGICAHAQQAKYIFLFIGDGMAMPQISSAEVYAGALAGSDVDIKKLTFTRFPNAGIMTTYDAGSFITDSASAGTAMASGYKTLSGIINMDPAKRVKYTPITYDMKKKGYKIGIISSVSLDHATPASFYAAVESRGDMYNIAVQLAKSGFDYFAGGGFVKEKGKDGQPDIYSVFKDNGYKVVNSNADFKKLKGSKLIMINEKLQDAKSMSYEVDRKADDLSLAEHTKKAIEILDNSKGFFLMVEGGKIDWACHANDAAAAIHDVISLDKAVQEAVAFYNKHPNDTVIIVTGDHETGGMTLGFAGTQYATFFDKVASQKGSFIRFNDEILTPYKKSAAAGGLLSDLDSQIKNYFGFAVSELSSDEQAQVQLAFKRSMGGELENTTDQMLFLLFGGYEPLTVKLTQIMNQRAGIGWTSYAHTGVPIPVFAIGKGGQHFTGYYDNTDIYKYLAALAGVETAGKKVALSR